MDFDDLLPSLPGDLLASLSAQDLDPLSVGDLEGRIAALTREIARCRARIEAAVNHRASVEGLFRR